MNKILYIAFAIPVLAVLVAAMFVVPKTNTMIRESREDVNRQRQMLDAHNQSGESGVHIHDDSHHHCEHEEQHENVVCYTEDGFYPFITEIEVGETVLFLQDAHADLMWVSSNDHPTHELYGGTQVQEHCRDPENQAFDQCGNGERFEFVFSRVGEWLYHNHSNAFHEGLIIVRE